MLGSKYEHEICSAAKALELVGERWSLLILRNAAFAKMSRFTDFQKSLGVAPNILTRRLESFVEAGIMVASKENGEHAEYHLTERGLDLKTVIISLTEWGDKWVAESGPPILYEHENCESKISLKLQCNRCRKSISPKHIVAKKTKVMIDFLAKRKSKK